MTERKMNRLITIDTAEGLGGDFCVANFLRFDLENKKIIQEAVIRNNSLPLDTFAGYVYGIAQLLGFPFLLFENNNKSGGEFKKTIVEQYGYRNVYRDQKKKEWGISTNKLNKKLGVRTFKTLIDSSILQINDYDTYLELNYFEKKPNGSYKAREGYTDDLIMSLVIFCAVYTQHKDLFGLQYGRKSILDYMLNPALESKLTDTDLIELTDEEKLEKMLNHNIEEKKGEAFGMYDWEIEYYKEMNIDILKLQEAGVNMSIFKMGSSGANSDDIYKSRKVF